MATKSITIDIPDFIAAAVTTEQRDLPQFLKRTLAVELYREGRLSLGKSAELAGVSNKWEMIVLLNERNVPLRYSAEDAENDLRSINEAVR